MKLYKILLLFVLTLCLFVNLYAQIFMIEDLKKNEWVMDGNPIYSICFTDSFMITTWIIEGKEVVSQPGFYLSDTPVKEYDISKIGKCKSGKYIVREYKETAKDGKKYIKTHSFPIFGISEDKLELEFANKSVYTFHRKEQVRMF